MLSIWSVLLQSIIANQLCAAPDRLIRFPNNQLFRINCRAVSDPVESFVNPLFLRNFLFFYLWLDRLSVIANKSRVPTFDWKFCSLWYCYQEGVFRFQSIPKLSKSVLSDEFLRFPSRNVNHPDTLLLTYRSIPIPCHSFRTRIVLLLTGLRILHPHTLHCCMAYGIPELLLLTNHSFLAMTELFRTRYC